MWWRMISFDDVHNKLLVLNETLMKVWTVNQISTSFCKNVLFGILKTVYKMKEFDTLWVMVLLCNSL